MKNKKEFPVVQPWNDCFLSNAENWEDDNWLIVYPRIYHKFSAFHIFMSIFYDNVFYFLFGHLQWS